MMIIIISIYVYDISNLYVSVYNPNPRWLPLTMRLCLFMFRSLHASHVQICACFIVIVILTAMLELFQDGAL